MFILKNSRFSGDREFDTLVVSIRICVPTSDTIRRRYHVTFLPSYFFFPSFTERERGRETHLSIEPRRALAITRSAVRKRVASSFTAHRHSMALYFLSSDVSVSRTRLCRPPPPRPAAEYLTYCSRYIFRRAAALERYFTTR